MILTKRIFRVSSYKQTQKIFDVVYPIRLTKDIIDFGRKIGVVLILEINEKHNSYKHDCHTNVRRYISKYGGKEIICFYLLEDAENNKNYSCIRHSIVEKDGELIDITPSNNKKNIIIIPRFNFYLNFKSIEFLNGKINLVK